MKKSMPAERLVYSTLHAGGKFDNNAYKTSGVSRRRFIGHKCPFGLYGCPGLKEAQVHFHEDFTDLPLENGLLPVLGKTETNLLNFLPDRIFEITVFFDRSKVKTS